MASSDPKSFLLEHMTESERLQGRIPKSRRNDQLAQEILADVDSRPAPKPNGPATVESHVDGVDVHTYSREETDRMREAKRKSLQAIRDNQELFLKHRAIRYLRQFPDCKKYFDQIRYWMTDRVISAEDKQAAKLKGTVEAAKVIDLLLGEYQKRTGRPWYFIRKGKTWINPRPDCP